MEYVEILNRLLKITSELNAISDKDALLEKILLESRKITNADAGSIYLKKRDYLFFKYVQNDTFDKNDPTQSRKLLYSNIEIPINESSIAGYVALNNKILVIDDVYNISHSEPYSFNKDFDKKSGYKTKSMFVIPLVTKKHGVIGVMQIINKLEKGIPISFSQEDKTIISIFANSAASAIQQARMTHELVMRMIKMANMRDPKETGTHVNRVGSYSIEIYNAWARKHNIDATKISEYKSNFKIAAMLHDIGKIGISDAILKKPGRLTPEEFVIMKTHTLKGSEIFEDKFSPMEELAAEISKTHHEKWDGTGYPFGLKGEEIPISGRIVALADVFDALSSKRSYKSAWTEEDVLKELRNQSGKHFDPQVVDAFFEVYDVIKLISEKYKNN